MSVIVELNQFAERARRETQAQASQIQGAAEDLVRAGAAYQARLEQIDADQAAELARHTDALQALAAQRDDAVANYETARAEAIQRLHGVSAGLTGAKPARKAG